MEEPQAPTFRPGEGLRILGLVIVAVAVALAFWAILSPTSVSISETDRVLAQINPEAHPLPAVNNIGLMQTKLLLFLGAGFSLLTGTGLYGCGAIIGAIGGREGAKAPTVAEATPGE